MVSLLAVGCYDSFDPAVPTSQAMPSATSTIADIHTLYGSGMREISGELTVEGVVTANDEYGNFYKSFVVESDGYAIEVLDGLYDSYVRHPLGSSVVVNLSGLGLDRYLGVLRTGLVAPATSSYSLDYMGSEAVVDLYVTVSAFGDEATAQQMQISELSEDQAGKLININSLTLHTEDGVERSWSGYSLFRDASLDSIWCYTSSYASFAAEKIPQCEVSLSGILEYGSTDSATNQFILKLRGSNDCNY